MSKEKETPKEEGLALQNQITNGIEEQISLAEKVALIAANIEEGEVVDLDLAADYWTPTGMLESKRLVFLSIQERLVEDINDPNEKKLLSTAFFVEKTTQNGKETLRRVCNSSKKLLGVLTDNNIQPGTGLFVTYLGKVKNKTNSFSSDSWSIKPIKVQI